MFTGSLASPSFIESDDAEGRTGFVHAAGPRTEKADAAGSRASANTSWLNIIFAGIWEQKRTNREKEWERHNYT